MTNAEKVLQKLEQKIIALLTRRRKMMLRIAGLPDSLLDADIYGIPLSQGTVSNMLQRMRKKSKIPMEVIRQMFMQSTVGGADESGLTIDGDGNWIWVFQTGASAKPCV